MLVAACSYLVVYQTTTYLIGNHEQGKYNFAARFCCIFDRPRKIGTKLKISAGEWRMVNLFLDESAFGVGF